MSRGGPSDAHHRSLAKAISWRLTGSVDTFVISFLITGRIGLAAPIALTELLTKIGLYYLHERVWTHIHWGKNRIIIAENAES